MTTTLTAVFDGKVLRPEKPLKLKPNTRCKLTLQSLPKKGPKGGLYELLEKLTGSIEMPEDWAEEHDHYLYGTPKRRHKKRA